MKPGKQSLRSADVASGPFETCILEEGKSDLSVCLQKTPAIAMLLCTLYAIPKDHIILQQC